MNIRHAYFFDKIKIIRRQSNIIFLFLLLFLYCFPFDSFAKGKVDKKLDLAVNVSTSKANSKSNTGYVEKNIRANAKDIEKKAKANTKTNTKTIEKNIQPNTKGVEKKVKASTKAIEKNVQVSAKGIEEKIKVNKKSIEKNVKANAEYFNKETIEFSKLDKAKIEYIKNLNLLRENDELNAANGFSKIIETLPTFHPARAKLIDLYFNIGWNNEAVELLEEGLTLAPRYTKFILQKTNLLIKEDKFDEALTLVLKIPKAELNETKNKALLAYLYLQLGLFEASERCYRKLITQDFGNNKWWLGLALSLEFCGKTKEAINSYSFIKKTSGINKDILDYVDNKIEKLNSSMGKT